jgi:predicted deacylase
MAFNLKKAFVVVFVIAVVLFAGIFALSVLKKQAPVEQVVIEEPKKIVIKENIGISVQGRNIESYTYGFSNENNINQKKMVFVGGIHGGYEWNSVLLSYQMMDYLEKNPTVIPENVNVTIIPSANPDAVYRVVGKEGRFGITDVSKDQELLASARFNANQVDLNRNFDCDWKKESMWRSKKVSAGSEPFSEPEAKALQQFFIKNNPDLAVFWHSQANAVYPGDCKGVFLPENLILMDVYANASGYLAQKTFDSYVVNGAADGWLTTVNIPTLTVELKTHETVEFEQNLAGVKALFGYYSKK